MLRENINDAMKTAMKSQDKLRLSTLRLVNAAIKNADIEARTGGKGPLADEDLLGLLQKMIKQRQESVELYDKGGRKELADQERGERSVELVATNFEEAARFYQDIWGLQPVESRDGTRLFRGTGAYHHILGL